MWEGWLRNPILKTQNMLRYNVGFCSHSGDQLANLGILGKLKRLTLIALVKED